MPSNPTSTSIVTNESAPLRSEFPSSLDRDDGTIPESVEIDDPTKSLLRSSQASDSGVKTSEHVDRFDLEKQPDADNSSFVDDLDILPKTDDTSLPALTFRTWLLGSIFCLILAVVNTTFSFRTNSFVVSPYIAVILSFPMGIFLANTLPTRKFKVFGWEFSFNPGPFNYKEHTLIYVFASTGASPVYALFNIVGQKYTLRQPLHTGWALVFGFVTQCFGYALAGLCRRFLVRPKSMIWPGNLSIVALLFSLSSQDEDKKQPNKLSRFMFFWIIVAAMGLYSFLPSLVAPVLGAVSLICFMVPNNNRVKLFGSANQGLGMLSFSFDWSVITNMAPITTPLWALWNQVAGLWFFLWVVIPILYLTNAFGKDMELGSHNPRTFYLGGALNTPALFANNGSVISARSLVQVVRPKGGAAASVFGSPVRYELNATMYESVAPIRITTYFAMEYFTSFVVFAAALSHVYLWYGKQIYERFRASISEMDIGDIHAQLMDKYEDVPDLWYYILLFVNVTLGIVVCEFGGFDLPWWGVLLALVLAGITMIPIGTIQAVSGQQIGLNVMSEFLIGLILPGRMVAVMSFKTLSYMSMSQGLTLVADLKLGHYMKIPPRAMFVVQLVSTIAVMIVNVFTAFFIYDRLGVQFGGASGWTAVNYKVFFNAGAIWGAVGPARFFGSSSPYSKLLWGFLIGLLLPVLLWLAHWKIGGWWWQYINIPVIAVFPSQVGSTRSDLITPVVIGVTVNYFLKKYAFDWWRKYALVMSAGFDTGVAITVAIIFFCT
ncbi:OPT oligopeptide transporter protein-domain-containing protein [Zopfochytrium polystomum]|nr:OPT oligopeptide transporter protein-domain-containing protein [Zopfochytrium polystomum]